MAPWADRVRSVLGSRVGGGLVMAARPAATPREGASHTTGTVHHARLVEHVDRAVTDPVVAQAAVTCRRCGATGAETSDDLVIFALMPAVCRGPLAARAGRVGQRPLHRRLHPRRHGLDHPDTDGEDRLVERWVCLGRRWS
jgi:hypothetical protein